MKIAYIGRVALSSFAIFGKWDKVFPDVKWGFPLGSEIVKRLVKKGHEVFVVTEHTVDTVQKFSCSTTCGRLEVWLVPSWKRSRWTFLTLFYKEMKGIRAAIREIVPDVVFAHWTYHNAYAGLTSGYPTLVVAHDSPWRVARMFRNMQTLIRAIYATLFVIPKIRHLTAVSPHMVEEFRKFRRLRNLDIPVIPNGIEILRDPPSLKLWRTSESGLMREHPPTIVCISQAGRLKNSSALFKAWEILRPKHPDWRLKVFGQGMPDGLLPREELDRILREEADLFVSPSLEESFGMVFVEAMRFGVPCIGGERSGAVPWVIGDGGVVCDVTIPKKLADCIEKVMTDNELLMRLGEEGKKRVREAFDIEKVVDMYEAELMKVAGC